MEFYLVIESKNLKFFGGTKRHEMKITKAEFETPALHRAMVLLFLINANRELGATHDRAGYPVYIESVAETGEYSRFTKEGKELDFIAYHTRTKYTYRLTTRMRGRKNRPFYAL